MLFNYTTELRTFFENLPLNADQSLPHVEVIENGRTKLFDFDYPIFDANYRKVFETHFIRRFYMRQIGFESVGLFKFQLESWLIINMPYFNKLFESELLKYDPLTNSKMESTYNKKNDKTQSDTKTATDTKTVDGESNVTSNRINHGTLTTDRTETSTNEQISTMNGNNESSQIKDESGSTSDDNFSRQLESNNPDSRLSITANDGEGVIEYASSIKENTDNNSKSTQVNGTNTGTETTNVNSENTGEANINEDLNTTTTSNDNLTDHSTTNISQTDIKNDTLVSTINDVEDFIQHRVGKIGVQSFAKLVKEYRSSLLRIENQIFDEMNQLFMLVY